MAPWNTSFEYQCWSSYRGNIMHLWKDLYNNPQEKLRRPLDAFFTTHHLTNCDMRELLPFIPSIFSTRHYQITQLTCLLLQCLRLTLHSQPHSRCSSTSTSTQILSHLCECSVHRASRTCNRKKVTFRDNEYVIWKSQQETIFLQSSRVKKVFHIWG